MELAGSLFTHFCWMTTYVLYLVRKVFSRRIQRCRLRGMGPSILRENRQLSDRPLSDQIKHIATFLIQPLLSGLPPLCVGRSPSVVHRFGWCLACFGGRNVGLISRIFGA